MTVTYDSQADAAYIRFIEGPITTTVEESDVCSLDYGTDGQLAGIELLSVFGFAGASLHSLVGKGLVSQSFADKLLADLRTELVAA
jgi:uncharacterized protein YuzE